MLKELKKCLKNELKENDIFDIVVYGSMVKGKARPGDIDILVIFTQGTLKERLSKLQVIKKKIKFDNVDVKAVLWNELFDPAFFAKTGIFLEGVSLKNLKKFSLKIGFYLFYKLRNYVETIINLIKDVNLLLQINCGKGDIHKLIS
mgnify:CR=1 FL=1